MIQIRTNETALDTWTLAHVATGVTAARVGLPFLPYMVLSVLFEVWEHKMEYPNGSKLFGTKRPESKINVAADVVLGAAGYLVAQRALER